MWALRIFIATEGYIMSQFPLLLGVLLPLAIPFCSSSGVSLVLRNNTDIDYIVEVNDSLQFNSSESGFVQGTAENPCKPPAMCVEFYPRASSFLIKPGAYENYSAVSLSSSDNKLGHIAIVVVRENKFIPAHIGGKVYKIMRVTGTIKNESLSFSLANGDGSTEVYKFTPQDNAGMLVYPTYFLEWPNTAYILTHSGFLALAVASLNMSF
ncbi:unnamed protein product [Dibothriocephalus latus]|uniref:Uncharacterized protein n=1 Tax=Dibothriocephalus latus TaxID=60516 RepID=A0A3P7L5J4_DIBLA|nr:unnamed protein product [Dibothriocephalus latus]